VHSERPGRESSEKMKQQRTDDSAGGRRLTRGRLGLFRCAIWCPPSIPLVRALFLVHLPPDHPSPHGGRQGVNEKFPPASTPPAATSSYGSGQAKVNAPAPSVCFAWNHPLLASRRLCSGLVRLPAATTGSPLRDPALQEPRTVAHTAPSITFEDDCGTDCAAVYMATLPEGHMGGT
jgi:hypothetical protein